MNMHEVMCPSCGELFEVVGPAEDEWPAEWDYDCEICCRPMLIVFEEFGVHAKGLGE